MPSKKTVWEKILYNEYMYNEDEALNKATHSSNDTKIDRLLAIGADPYEETYIHNTMISPIAQAARKGDIGLMDKFLNADCTKRADAIIYARREAVYKHKVESITHLFGQGYTEGVETDRLTAMRGEYDPVLMKALFENGDLSTPTQEELGECVIEAAKSGSVKNIEYLKNLGAPLDAYNGTDNALTAIAKHKKISANHLDVVTYLKENGFPEGALDCDGKTGAEIAAANGQKELTLKIDPDFPKDLIKKSRMSSGPDFVDSASFC